MPVPSNFPPTLRKNADHCGHETVQRLGALGSYQYVWQLPRDTVNLSDTFLPLISLYTPTQVCDRLLLNLAALRQLDPAAPTPSQFELQVVSGLDYGTDLIFQGVSKLLAWTDSGDLVLLSGKPATAWDIYIRGIAPGSIYDINLRAITDLGRGNVVSTYKGSLML